MKVLIVDDHPMIRQGLRMTLENEPDIRVEDEASDAATALQMLGAKEYGIAIIDINLPDLSGLEVINQLRVFNRQLPVLVLSIHSEETIALRAIKAGADGFLNKGCTPDEMLRVLRKLVAGGKHFSSEIMFRLVRKASQIQSTAPHEELSDREYQVLCKLATGVSVTTIAEQLGLSPNTVSTYRARIFEKLAVTSNAELTRYALTHQLIA